MIKLKNLLNEKADPALKDNEEKAVAKEKRDIISQRIEQKAFEQQKSVGCNKVIGGI